MEFKEEEKEYGSVRKYRHMKISRRDTILNDLRNSTVQGILSFVFSLLSLMAVLFSVFFSFRKAGKGGIVLGLLVIIAILFAVLSIVLGVLGFKNRGKIRHYMEKRGIIISSIVIAASMALYVWGAASYFS